MVAFELKRESQRGAVEQLVGYLSSLEECYPGRSVSGVIISGATDPVALEALDRWKNRFRLTWYRYSVAFEREG